jgi:long-chain fatty acid transport protein
MFGTIKCKGDIMKKIVLISLVASSALMAAGYKVPESSLNAVALSNAYVANASGADASYYNPAKMAFSTAKSSDMEVDLTYIGLSKVDYHPVSGSNISSKAESFIVPTIHYVSPAVDKFRFGLSIVSPAGLSKKWDDAPGSTYAKEFTLQTIEVNPTVAYKINDQFAVALGVRGIHSSGVVKNAYYDLKGDGFDWGYNVALTYQPMKDTNIALTYRSNVDLHVSGDATNVLNTTASGRVDSGVKVSIPVPAALNLGVAHTYSGNTTVEFVFERTMWSAYKNLDFDFDNSNVYTPLQAPSPKNWKDSNTYRLGLTHKYNDLTAMAGVAYDESPVPDSTLGYENPDSNGKIISLGGRYDINKNMSIGLSGLVSFKDNRSVNNTPSGGHVNGEFANSRAYLLTTGLEYKY